ncbi:MAG: hypothetical protein M3R24_04500 [Chloroflexota bacterium]|nr:hypothetical protein [Chloroflexota bacterium]
MAGKKNLDDMLTQDTSKPPIRRGQGIRLSTDTPLDASGSAPSPPAMAEVSSTESAQVRKQENAQASKSESAQVRNQENAQASKRTSAQSHDVPERIARVSQGQRLRVDLVKQLKRIAVEEDRKLYEVMEEAIALYLERRRQGGR